MVAKQRHSRDKGLRSVPPSGRASASSEVDSQGKAQNMLSNKRVLVTGAGGFLGGWLCASLVEAGAHVIALDRVFPSQSPVLNELSSVVELVYGDIENFEYMLHIINACEVDFIYHLAAQALVQVAARNPLSTFKSNIQGTWNILDSARLLSDKVKGIIVASSDKAYGDQTVLPYKEEAPMEGRFPYDVSKSCADLIARSYFHSYKLPVCVSRCGNLYGGGDFAYSRIIPGTIRSVLAGENPLIRSDGTPVRDYVYVKDAAQALLTLSEHMLSSRALHGEAFNISNESPISVLDLVQRILTVMKRTDLKANVLGNASLEIQAQYLSASKIRERLGWAPRFDLESGLAPDNRVVPPQCKQPQSEKMNARAPGRYEGKRVLITGATGFIGRHLASALVQEQSTVFCLVRGERRSEEPTLPPGAKLLSGDLNDVQQCARCMEQAAPEIVFNLASAKLRDASSQALFAHWTTTASGAVNLAYQGLRHENPLIVQIGSSEEYGDGPTPFIETQEEKPISAYSLGKVSATRFLLTANALNQLAVIIVRPTVVYGPGQTGEMFIPSLIKHYTEGSAPSLTSCEQTRDFLYIDDLISALLLLGLRRDLSGHIFNVGSGTALKLSRAVDLVAKLCAYQGDSGINKRENRQHEVMHHLADNEKIYSQVGWRPQMDIEEGLARTVKWWKEKK